jgi:hypothetical protein
MGKLGFEPQQLTEFMAAITAVRMIWSRPTGLRETTTLYSALSD